MKIHYIPLGILALSLLVIGLTGFITDLGNNYGTTANTATIQELNSEFEVMINQSEILKDRVDAFIPEEGESAFSYLLPYKFLAFGWQLIKTFFVSILTLGGITETLGKALVETGVPLSKEIISAIISAMLFVTIAMIGYALYKDNKPSDSLALSGLISFTLGSMLWAGGLLNERYVVISIIMTVFGIIWSVFDRN